MAVGRARERSPGIQAAPRHPHRRCLLAIPIFMVWFLVYDRQQPVASRRARRSPQAGAGRRLSPGRCSSFPIAPTATETVVENGQSVTRSREVIARAHACRPETVELATDIRPERRKRSIYEAVVYEARVDGKARFAFPPDLAAAWRRRSPTWTSAAPSCASGSATRAASAPIRGLRSTAGRCAFSPAAAAAAGAASSPGSTPTPLRARPIAVDFAYEFRGNGALSLAPQAGDTRWTVTSAWPHPSFGGAFLPPSGEVDADGLCRAPTGSATSRSAARWFRPADAGARNVVERVRAGRRAITTRTPVAGNGARRPRRSA